MDSLVAGVSLFSLNETTGPAPNTRRRTRQRNRPPPETSVAFPQHHPMIAEQLPFMSWQEPVSDDHHTRAYDTNIMGKFRCSNRKCEKRGWRSNVVAITIRMFDDDKYNAVVYKQCCKSCETLGSMSIDVDSYVDRVVYRLKRWLDIEVETPPYSDDSKGPHESSLCEGCKAGHCTNGRSGYSPFG